MTEPQLDKPGAGLPAPELLIARRLFAWKRRFGRREGFSKRFLAERDAIGMLVNACPEERRSERVLIPRLRGLEDSSRHWSVWMVLDHLRITNHAFAGAISALAAGRIPPEKADTAAVKPDPSVEKGVEADFEGSCDRLVAAVESVADLRTASRYAHPWFGPLDAFGWHALSATHLAIHRSQIEAILRRLAAT